MTVRELCEQMVKDGRAIKHGNNVMLINRDGSESICIKNNKGRLYWHIRFENRYRYLPVQNLVWLAHGKNLENGKTLDHIDRNPMNNSIDNLRLATPAEQTQNRRNSKTTPELRSLMRDQYQKGLKTILGMARELGLCREIVQDIIHKRYAYDQLERLG